MSDVTSYREPAFGELKSQSAYEQRHEEGESKRATVQEAKDMGRSYATETRAKSSGTAAEDIRYLNSRLKTCFPSFPFTPIRKERLKRRPGAPAFH